MDIYTNKYFYMDMYTIIVFIHYICCYVCKFVFI